MRAEQKRATGPNAVANVLDLTLFGTVAWTALEEYWQPWVFGTSAQPLLDGSRTAEKNIWKLAETMPSWRWSYGRLP